MDTLLRGYGTQPRWTFPGMIMPFSGTFGGDGERYPIPLGEDAPDMHWCLCDGTTTNGLPVPDLRGRMIRGASDSVPAGSTGGSEKHSHSLSGTVGDTTLSVAQMANHTHQCSFVASTDRDAGSFTNGLHSPSEPRLITDSTGDSQPHTHSLSGVSSEAAGSLPPYYALSFIMRIA